MKEALATSHLGHVRCLVAANSLPQSWAKWRWVSSSPLPLSSVPRPQQFPMVAFCQSAAGGCPGVHAKAASAAALRCVTFTGALLASSGPICTGARTSHCLGDTDAPHFRTPHLRIPPAFTEKPTAACKAVGWAVCAPLHWKSVWDKIGEKESSFYAMPQAPIQRYKMVRNGRPKVTWIQTCWSKYPACWHASLQIHPSGVECFGEQVAAGPAVFKPLNPSNQTIIPTFGDHHPRLHSPVLRPLPSDVPHQISPSFLARLWCIHPQP